MRSKKPSLRRSQMSFSILSGTPRRLVLAFVLTTALLILATSALASFTFLLKWGTSGTAEGQFITPRGIAIDSAGNVYVADVGSTSVEKFDSSGTFLLRIGTNGDVPGGFVEASGVAVDAAGNIYTSDYFTDRIQKFDLSGTLTLNFGGMGSGNGKFENASGVAVDSAGNIYASDANNHRIQKFNSAGVFITKWGSIGTGDGQFSGPQGLAIDSSDNVYVADTGNNRIQKFTAAGVFITKWGTTGSGNGEFSSPYGVNADSLGTVFVADTGNNRVQTFSASGTFIEAFGTAGSGDGEFSGPQDLAPDAFGNVYVTDSGNDRVQKFGVAAAVIANAGTDQTVECAGADTSVTLDGTASTGGGTLSYAWKEGTTNLGNGATLTVALPLGSHTITLTVASSSGGSADDTVVIDVVDTAAPTLTLNGSNPLTVECHTSFTDPGATASDGCAGDLTSAITFGGSVNANVVGTYALTYSVSDGFHTTTTTRTVNVVDTTPPVITLNGQTPSMWPPNHKYQTFRVTDFVTSVTDSCGTSLGVSAVVISQVTSDEPVNSGGDGNTLGDIVIAPGCTSVQLRVERAGGGNGRVYTITFRVADASGNNTTATARVTVPKSQGSGPAVDDGPHYTVVGSCP
jgi:sugar lactone lactonase YvrE